MLTTQTTQWHATGNLGFGSLLAIVFITLKLCGVITWSWWWVLAPLWLPFVLVFAVLGLILLIACVIQIIATLLDRAS